MSAAEQLGPDTDHYDAADVMNDVELPRAPAVSLETQKAAVRAVVKQAQRLRLPPPRLTVTPSKGELGEVCDLEDVLGELLGVSASVDKVVELFTPTISSAFPMTHKLYRKFKAALPAPKNVRVDTALSYEKFRSEKRAPYLADLEKTAEEHASADANLADEDVLGAEVEMAKLRANDCGERIPLSLSPAAAPHVNAWRDGEQIFCSVRLPGPDGHVRIVTSSTPLERHTDEVLGYATDAGVDPVEVMNVLPGLAQILGGGSLVTQITKAAPQLMAQDEVVAGKVFIGRIEPECDPAIAAVMMLLQLCKKGSEQACWEAQSLSKTENGHAVLAAAQRGLAQAESDRSKKGNR